MTNYNLLLVHTPGKQDLADFLTVRNMMIGKAPDIEVTIVSSGQPISTDLVSELSKRPTLIFSPMPISFSQELRGKLLVPPSRLKKHDEFRILRRANLPVPETILLTRFEQLADVPFSGRIVVKPNHGLRGHGVRLLAASALKTWSRERFEGSESNKGGMIVQPFINTGPQPSSYRVMTVMGRPIYCDMYISNLNLDTLHAEQLANGVPVASNIDDRTMKQSDEMDVIALAREAHRMLDFTPVMGADIVRCALSGKLYILELNPCGWTWHLSSDPGKESQRKFSLNRYDQFNALKTLADLLIQETRSRAV
jgi:hypothetical protein